MEIYKDIYELREKIVKDIDKEKIEKILGEVDLKSFPIADNINNEKLNEIIEIVKPSELASNLIVKHNLKIPENLKDFEEKILKVLSGKEIDIDEENLLIYEIILRCYGIIYTIIWNVFKNRIDLSKFDKNFCPICGSNFEYGYLDEERRKFLVCDLCRFPWRYPRIKCPICGNEDQKKLYYYQFEDDYDFVRVYKCTNCNQAHKVILLEKLKNYPSVELANIKTLDFEEVIEDEKNINN